MKFINNMTNKEKQINESFKDYKIKIDVEVKRIIYKSNNWWLGTLSLKRNNFVASYYLMKHFKNRYQMYEFITHVIGKIIDKKINEII